VLFEIPTPVKICTATRSTSITTRSSWPPKAADEGEPGAGMRVYDVSSPTTEPKFVSYFDTSDRVRAACITCGWAARASAYLTTGSADFTPKRATTTTVLHERRSQRSRASKRIGRWWYPGQRTGDSTTVGPVPIIPSYTPIQVYRPHNIDVFRVIRTARTWVTRRGPRDPRHQRSRASKNREHLTLRLTRLHAHGVSDLFAQPARAERRSDRRSLCGGREASHALDIADEKNPRLLSVMPYAKNTVQLCNRDGRYGAHNIYETSRTVQRGNPTRRSSAASSRRRARLRHHRPARSERSRILRPRSTSRLTQTRNPNQRRYVDDRGYIFACDASPAASTSSPATR